MKNKEKLPNGTWVKTHTDLPSFAQMTASFGTHGRTAAFQRTLEMRRPGASGKITDAMIGYPDFYWVEHPVDGGVAPYSYDEFEVQVPAALNATEVFVRLKELSGRRIQAMQAFTEEEDVIRKACTHTNQTGDKTTIGVPVSGEEHCTICKRTWD